MYSQRLLQISLGFLFVLFSIFYQIDTANAAQIKKVKGKRVLIVLEGTEASDGDLFYAVSSSGKKTAIIKISKARGGKAIGRILKGKARKGFSVIARDASKRGKKSSSASSSGGGSGKMYYGGVAGFNSSDMTILDSGTGDTITEMSGSSFSAKALFDYLVFGDLWFRALGGFEMISASSGDQICGDANDEQCTTDITYIALDLWGRYLFGSGSFRPWVGVGFNLLFPASKESTAIDTEQINSTSLLSVGFGVDWFLSGGSFIPVQLEYSMFPDSNTVEATTLAIRAGIGWSF